MAAAGWTEHANEIVPMVVQLGKTMVWLIGTLGTLLVGVIAYVGRMMAGRFHTMEAKIDAIHQVQLMCTGCAEASRDFKRRTTDFD